MAADSEVTAVDLPKCENTKFKIKIWNTGNCSLAVGVLDNMEELLKYISSDPEPDDLFFELPFYWMIWVLPEYWKPGELVEIEITAHVEGPECTNSYNHILVNCPCIHGMYAEEDEDSSYVYVY